MRQTGGLRADAARNLDTVLEAGARLLADDPGASIAAIAAEAGVDRRTVYRRFDNRGALVDAIHRATLDAVDEVLADARLDCAPVAVALHRLVEGFVSVLRRYPIEPERMRCDAELHQRVLDHMEQLAVFMRRAADEGLIRSDLPDGLASGLLKQIINVVARQPGEPDPGPAADLAVEILLHGTGRGRSSPDTQLGG